MIKSSNKAVYITISKTLLAKVHNHLNGEKSFTNYVVNLIEKDLKENSLKGEN